MSKKNDQALTQEAPPQQPRPDQAEQKQPVSSGLIWTFWGGVLAALISARVLDAMLPAVPERVIERWVMLAFAGFLGVFLIKIK